MNTGGWHRGSTKGFTLVEVIVTIIIVAILAAIGGSFISSDDLDLRLEAERVAEGIRWAQNYAIGHACYVGMTLSGNHYRIYEKDVSSPDGIGSPIDWPLVFGNCTGDHCTLNSRVEFPADIQLIIKPNGGSYPQYSGSGSDVFDDYRIVIPILKVGSKTMNDALWVVISTVSGIVRVLDINGVAES